MSILFFIKGNIFLEAVNQAFVSLEKKYDATFCGKLPKHQTNSIQQHGVLLLFYDSISTVLQVSENVPGNPVPYFHSEQFQNFLVQHTLNRLN